MPTTAERVRTYRGPAILSYGFRPFFCLAPPGRRRRRGLVAVGGEQAAALSRRAGTAIAAAVPILCLLLCWDWAKYLERAKGIEPA